MFLHQQADVLKTFLILQMNLVSEPDQTHKNQTPVCKGSEQSAGVLISSCHPLTNYA